MGRSAAARVRPRPPPVPPAGGSSPHRGTSRQRLDLAAHAKQLRVQFPIDALDAVARQWQTARLQQFLQSRLRILELAEQLLIGQSALEPAQHAEPSRLQSAVQVERATHRFERIGQDRFAAKSAALELARPQGQQLPRAALAAACCARNCPLTTRARRRLKVPSSASGKRSNRYCAVIRLSTASPRNSSRSLLAPSALRCVNAVAKPGQLGGLVPERLLEPDSQPFGAGHCMSTCL